MAVRKIRRGRETLSLVSLTKREYLGLDSGNTVYDSSGARWKVSSVKRWATRPDDRQYGLKHGLYDHATFSVTRGKPEQTLYKTKGAKLVAAKAVKGTSFRIGERVKAKMPIPKYGAKPIPTGSRGTIIGIRPLTAEQARLYHGGQKAHLEVTWTKGGTSRNVYPKQVTRAK